MKTIGKKEATGIIDGPQSITRVNHGATAGTARPTVTGIVLWIGSVEPTNAVDGDLWLELEA